MILCIKNVVVTSYYKHITDEESKIEQLYIYDIRQTDQQLIEASNHNWTSGAESIFLECLGPHASTIELLMCTYSFTQRTNERLSYQ